LYVRAWQEAATTPMHGAGATDPAAPQGAQLDRSTKAG
jgi:hypothetical protein